MNLNKKYVNANVSECAIDRYDILVALMESNDPEIKQSLSKLIHDMTLTERKTRQYLNAVNIKVEGNEKLLEYIQKMA